MGARHRREGETVVVNLEEEEEDVKEEEEEGYRVMIRTVCKFYTASRANN